MSGMVPNILVPNIATSCQAQLRIHHRRNTSMIHAQERRSRTYFWSTPSYAAELQRCFKRRWTKITGEYYKVRSMFKCVIFVLVDTPSSDRNSSTLLVYIGRTLHGMKVLPNLCAKDFGPQAAASDASDIIIAPLRDALEWVLKHEDQNPDSKGPLTQHENEDFEWDPELGNPNRDLQRAGRPWTGEQITPMLLLQHRDRSVYPKWLYSHSGFQCQGRLFDSAQDSLYR